MSRSSIELQPAAITTPSAVYYSRNTSQASLAPTLQTVRAFETNLERTATRTEPVTSKSGTLLIILSTTLVTGIGSMLNGLVTVTLPQFAVDLEIPEGLLLWPSSIQALTCGCTLLLSGSLADAIGSRTMYLAGCVLQAGFVLGCGLCRNGAELIVFRGLSGISLSFCLPSAVSILTHSFSGRRRNIAFAAMGGGQPVGFAIGLVLGGVLTESVGWRVGFYIAAAINAGVFALGLWSLPATIDIAGLSWRQKLSQITHEIDWVGAVIASVSLATLSYVFATITGNTSDIREPSSIALLTISFALVPVFILWVGRQERLGRPAIIPNSLWRNKTFTAICLAVFMTWGAFNAVETILTFYFQKVQELSATQTSLRFLPSPVAGVAVNLAMGLLVHRVRADILVLVGMTTSCAASLTMAFAKPDSSYWDFGFVANLLNPVGADSLFTIANLLITSTFPAKTQGLAGGVFNTISQIGKSVGLALVAVIASSVTKKSAYIDKSSPDALMKGYSAAFYFCLALSIATILVALWGLRRIGKVGHKRD